MKEKLENFHKSIDQDEGLASIRKTLTFVCITFLALNLTGATIEEANTFIFKIKFSNHEGLGYLFLLSIIFLTIRYYSYAHKYHDELDSFWRYRLLQDPRIYRLDGQSEEVRGLLGNKINDYGSQNPGLRNPEYKVTGFFKRSFLFDVDDHDDDGYIYTNIYQITLYKFDEKWRPGDYIHLLRTEFKYQVEAILKHRESLDLFTPYLMSICAILSFQLKIFLLK